MCRMLLVLILAVPASPAASQQISPEQVRLLEQLPPEQRADLLRSMGIDLPGQAAREELEFPELVIPPSEMPEEPTAVTLGPGDTVIVRLEPLGPAQASPAEARRQEEELLRNPRLQDVLGAFTYEISPRGEIVFRGLAAIPVAGLTEKQAARRIEADPTLRMFRASVLYLPLISLGPDALQPFGYHLFEGAPVTFAPATDVPVPADYVLGPGDELRVQLFGKASGEYTLVVDREGSLSFPDIGPIVVAGLTFAEARELIGARVDEQRIGVRVSVTMGQLRSIRVFVLGDVNRPGSFTVGGLSTMTHALFVSGGVSPIGSLRDVQLKRSGKVVSRLDLYDLLLRGDNSADERLMPNDVIFVPPRGKVVSVAGEVQRPAIYELAGERTVAQVVQLAGGLTPAAYRPQVRLERIDEGGGRLVETLDLSTQTGREFSVRSGDVVEIGPVLDILTDHVTLEGHVRRPGPYQWREGMRLTDLLPSVNALEAGADRRYVLVQRRPNLSGPLEVFSADLERALAAPGGPEDPVLGRLDQVTVFETGVGRLAVLDPVMERLRLQARFGDPTREVAVAGMVRSPGTYPLEDGMRVSDLVRAGGYLSDSAYGLGAEITRYEVADGVRREIDVIDVDLGGVLAGNPDVDLLLTPFDFLNIKNISQWRGRATMELKGEVVFPGTYAIRIGETLGEVIERAGGLTPQAFPEGSVFLRQALKQREQDQIDRLLSRMERDLAALTLQAARAGTVVAQASGRPDTSVAMGQSILEQLRSAEAVGRLVIDLPALLAGTEGANILVKDGDRLLVPDRSQEVTVIGEVQYATSHLFSEGATSEDYIRASGGMTVNADDERIYIVRANGAVIPGRDTSKWFRNDGAQVMRPGDTIVVPLDIDRLPALALWQSSTTILYNLAIAVAAIGSL